MISDRPDWVISRQRAWGVPIAVFVREKGDGSAEILQDEAVNKRIADAFEKEGADAWYMDGARERFLGPHANEEWKKVDDICDVWFEFRLDPCLRAGRSRAFSWARRHQAQGRRRPGYRNVSGRPRPAPRLVPFLAAGKLRHAWPGALRRRADPRLHARRERPQDVEVARQHRRAAKGDQGFRRRYPAALGLRHRLCRRPAHRPRNPEEHCRDLSQAAQLDPLDARHAASLQASGCRGACRHARTRTVDAARTRRASRDRPQGLRGIRLQDRRRDACGLHEYRICRHSISTSARTRCTATRHRR